jgi:hypothetical protein
VNKHTNLERKAREVEKQLRQWAARENFDVEDHIIVTIGLEHRPQLDVVVAPRRFKFLEADSNLEKEDWETILKHGRWNPGERLLIEEFRKKNNKPLSRSQIQNIFPEFMTGDGINIKLQRAKISYRFVLDEMLRRGSDLRWRFFSF